MNAIEIPLGGIPNLKTAQEFVGFINRSYGLRGKDLPFTMSLSATEEDWKKNRGYGASEAATILGMTEEWKTRRQLFENKAGIAFDEFKGNDLTVLGNRSEPLIRAMYAVEHPSFDVYDGTWLVFASKEFPWMTCSLDMIVVDRSSCDIFVGEIKTAIWSKKWGEYCPDNYLVQICQQMAITQFDGAFLLGRIRGASMGIANTANERSYLFRADNPILVDNIAYVVDRVNAFRAMVESKDYKPVINLNF